MQRYSINLLFIALLSTSVQATETAETADNLIKIKSAYGVSETISRLENLLEEKGMTVFARINHAEGAEKAEMELRRTELLIFGNPKVGTPLMQCDQTMGIELPQKALAWEDESDVIWLAYNNPMHMAKSYQLDKCQNVLKKVAKALSNFAKAATTKKE